MRARHEERHRPSGFSFAFADRVDFLHPQHWDAVTAQGSFFGRREILRVIDGSENVTPRYALILRDERPVAAVAAEIVRVTGEHLAPQDNAAKEKEPANLLQQALSPAAKIATAKFRERVLVAGNPRAPPKRRSNSIASPQRPSAKSPAKPPPFFVRWSHLWRTKITMISYPISHAKLLDEIRALDADWLGKAADATAACEAAGKYVKEDAAGKQIDGLWGDIKEVFIRLQHGKYCYCERLLESPEFKGSLAQFLYINWRPAVAGSASLAAWSEAEASAAGKRLKVEVNRV